MMDLQEQISFLERNREWHGLVEELERSLGGATQNAVKASLHLKLGRVLESKFLQSVKALKHFQDAYKLNPALLEALEEARFIYWDLGKTAMVQKLLELELKNMQDGQKTTDLLVELGEVFTDHGESEKARLFVRAGRIARRFAAEAVEGMLAQAYAADPANREAAALYENLLVEAQRTEAIREQQRQVLAATK